MKGYPKYIATKQDFENLLAVLQCRERALKDLRAIYEAKDEKATRVVSGSEETGDLVIEEIDNPMPLWKQKGFKSREEVIEIIMR